MRTEMKLGVAIFVLFVFAAAFVWVYQNSGDGSVTQIPLDGTKAKPGNPPQLAQDAPPTQTAPPAARRDTPPRLNRDTPQPGAAAPSASPSKPLTRDPSPPAPITQSPASTRLPPITDASSTPAAPLQGLTPPTLNAFDPPRVVADPAGDDGGSAPVSPDRPSPSVSTEPTPASHTAPAPPRTSDSTTDSSPPRVAIGPSTVQPTVQPPARRGDPATPSSSTPPGENSAGGGIGQQTYTIQSGDTLISIAREKYGDDNAWKRILEANPKVQPERLLVGQTIILPPTGGSPGADRRATSAPPAGGDLRASAAPPRAPAPASSPDRGVSRATYRVGQGDSLISIARNILKDEKRWRELYELNKDRIKSPDLLIEGLELRLPSMPGDSDSRASNARG